MVSLASLFRQTGYLGITGYENKMDMGISKSNKGFRYPSNRVDEFAFNVLDAQRSNLKIMLRTDASIPESFLLEDREDMRVVEPLSPDCLVTPLPQPFRNLAIPHATVMEFLDPIVKELLVFGVRGNPEC